MQWNLLYLSVGTNIPRFVKFARKAPDFTKLHEKQFKKMEGLDSYLEKVEKRSEVTNYELPFSQNNSDLDNIQFFVLVKIAKYSHIFICQNCF